MNRAPSRCAAADILTVRLCQAPRIQKRRRPGRRGTAVLFSTWSKWEENPGASRSGCGPVWGAAASGRRKTLPRISGPREEKDLIPVRLLTGMGCGSAREEVGAAADLRPSREEEKRA